MLLDGLVGQPFCQGVPGKQPVRQLPVVLPGENLRLFHHLSGSPALHQPPENIIAALPQGLFQEGHVEKGQLQASGAVRQVHVQDAEPADSFFVGDARHGCMDGTHLPGLRAVDPHRLPEQLVIFRVSCQQLVHRPDIQLPEQLLRLLSDAFQLCYGRFPIHRPSSFPPPAPGPCAKNAKRGRPLGIQDILFY